jgi:hypothetical protein
MGARGKRKETRFPLLLRSLDAIGTDVPFPLLYRPPAAVSLLLLFLLLVFTLPLTFLFQKVMGVAGYIYLVVLLPVNDEFVAIGKENSYSAIPTSKTRNSVPTNP